MCLSLTFIFKCTNVLLAYTVGSINEHLYVSSKPYVLGSLFVSKDLVTREFFKNSIHAVAFFMFSFLSFLLIVTNNHFLVISTHHMGV